MSYFQRRISNFPVAFFSMVMGLAGLTIAWQKAQHVFAIYLPLDAPLLATTLSVFLLFVAVYLAKSMISFGSVLNELKNPVKLHFFPTISISMLLLSIAFLSFDMSTSLYLWIAGSLMQLMFTLYVVDAWIQRESFEVQHLNPAWFIPAVGNVLVPVAGVQLGFVEISWFYFSIGMLFWSILLTIIFNRIMFHHPIQEKLLPTLFILIAPPAVGFIAYLQLNGELDAFARFLYFSSVFLTLVMVTQFKRFMKLEFFLTWWAYSFPLAAVTVASLFMFEASGVIMYRYIGATLLFVLTIIVTILAVKTIDAVLARKICVEES